jgi:hypothetical protein
LNIKEPEEWSKVTAKIVLKEGGSFLTTYYKNSLTRGKNFLFESRK